MKELQDILTEKAKTAIKNLFNVEVENLEFQQTRKEFEGDMTLVIFPLLKLIKDKPEAIGEKIGDYLKQNSWQVENFNIVKGFLNLTISEKFYTQTLQTILKDDLFGVEKQKKDAVIVEYSSPNTNKPLHLGHIRNNLLGFSVAQILDAAGKKVHKTQIINDRGIHICKSMVAWQLFGNGKTPQTEKIKGDKFVGNYYVEFDKAYKKQISDLISEGKSKEEAEKQASIFLEAQEMLRRWEAGDPKVISLWKEMNSWVYEGFSETYQNLGVSFDSYYYESNTYLLGKNVVEKGLEMGVFYKKEDGSVWCDLTSEGLDEKLVLRSDGTSVYMTQDLGTAIQRTHDIEDTSGMVYVVGNEQDYHFKVLFLILKKLGYHWAENLFHLSYGMVELPNGKMKSREGTVVDADDLLQEVVYEAQSICQELGKLEGYSEEQKQEIYRIIGVGALKYFILKYDPKKSIKFNPAESIDFQGNTAPFIQYAYARIRSILRKVEGVISFEEDKLVLYPKEKALLKQMLLFPEAIQQAASLYSPAIVANYTYDLVKEFNSFYQNVSILGEEDLNTRHFRILLCQKTSQTIALALSLLGIEVPERM